jgi:hypothetical protein
MRLCVSARHAVVCVSDFTGHCHLQHKNTIGDLSKNRLGLSVRLGMGSTEVAVLTVRNRSDEPNAHNEEDRSHLPLVDIFTVRRLR